MFLLNYSLRKKHLLSFDIGDSENEFLYHYFNMADNNPQYLKFEMLLISHRLETPLSGCQLWGFLVCYGELFRLDCCCLSSAVQPFAYVVANYACYNRDKKCGENFFHYWRGRDIGVARLKDCF